MHSIFNLVHRYGGANARPIPASTAPLPLWPIDARLSQGLRHAVPAAGPILDRAESTYEIYRVVFEEAAKGITGHDVDSGRVERALDSHVRDVTVGDAVLSWWAGMAAGFGFTTATAYASDFGTNPEGYRGLLGVFPPWVGAAVRLWESMMGWGDARRADDSEEAEPRWARYSAYRTPMHVRASRDAACVHCGYDWRFGPPLCPEGPCETCGELYSAHNQSTKACPAASTPARLR